MWHRKEEKKDEENESDEMKRLFDSRCNEIVERLKEQNNIIEKQNKTIEDMQIKADEQNKKHQDQIEHYVKITEELQAHIGSVNEIQIAKVDVNNKDDDSAEVNSAMVLSSEFSEEYERNTNEIIHHTVVFDVPAVFTLILRFAYSILLVIVTGINLNEDTTFNKRTLSFVTGGVMTVAIFLEMAGPRVRSKRTVMAYFFNAFSGLALWITYAYVDSEAAQSNFWIVGVVVIISELLLVIQLLNMKFPRTLILSHTFGAIACSFLLLGFYFPPIAFLIIFQILSIIQSILVLFDLPITEELVDRFIQRGDSHESASTDQSTRSIEKKISDFEKEDINTIALNVITNNSNTIASILGTLHHRLESVESTLSSSTQNPLPLVQLPNGEINQTSLSFDIYTMMLFSSWKLVTISLTFSRFKDAPVVIIIPRPSRSWTLGLIVFFIQIFLGSLSIVDQNQVSFFDTILQIPIKVSNTVRASQFLALILSIMTQKDILDSYKILVLLSWKSNKWQALCHLDESETRFSIWFARVAIPNILKILQGTVVLVTTFIVILQSDDVVDLLKDFTALFIISQIDNIFFYFAENGFFGRVFAKKTEEVKKAQIRHEGQYFIAVNFLFITIFFIFLGIWILIISNQDNGSLILKKYPNCTIILYYEDVKNGKCDSPKGVKANIPDCGWEAGDCLDFNAIFPNCNGVKPFRVGDGQCDGDHYNKLECMWDGGDCIKITYPNCKADDPMMVGNGRCDKDYNNEECGFDGGDCDEFNKKYPNCEFEYPSLLGNGICATGPNIEACGYDGGDCDDFNKRFPDCEVDQPDFLGDGECNGAKYNTTECGFDDSDCLPK